MGPRRILPALQLLVLLSLVLSTSGLTGPLRTAWAVLAVLLATAWTARARTARPGARAAVSILAIVLVAPVALVGTVGFSAPLLILAVALVVLDVSVRAGLAAMAGISLAGLALLMLGSGFVESLREAAPLAVLLLFGVALGAALRSYEERQARDSRAIDRLRHAAQTEKELLLADERARSARGLHDGLGQRLTLMSMSLEYAGRIRAQDPEAAWAEIAQAQEAAHGALTEMRTWVRALSPVRDPEARGAAALEAIAESFRGTGLEVQVSVAAEADALLESDEALSLQVYRTVQEGLTNALRHARARTVAIAAHLEQDDLVVEMVSDLGEEALAMVPMGPAERGFGLRSIAERAEECGGTLRAGREGDRFVLVLRLRTGR